jgi:hypothetical protein
VGRPLKELMRGWGRAPICKVFRPNHGLVIRATHNHAEKGKKGKCGGERKTCEEYRDKILSSWVQGRTVKKNVFLSQEEDTDSREGE